MCGRVCIQDNPDFLALFHSLGIITDFPTSTRYNVAPTRALDVVRLDDEPVHARMSWGFTLTVKGKTKPVTKRVSNARDDKVWTSPMWRGAITKNRALVPVSGFYEWRRVAGKPLQAYYITPSSSGAMWMAGLYKPSNPAEVSIVTTSANEAMAAVHDRMPVILGSTNEAMAWLQERERDSLDALMQPAAEDALAFTPVSDYVNKSTNDGPACISPIDNLSA